MHKIEWKKFSQASQNKETIMQKIIWISIAWMMFLSPSIIFGANTEEMEKTTEKKAVYDLRTGDIKKIEMQLISSIIKNIAYYQNHLEELHVKVVIHGESYPFFQRSSNPKMVELGKKLGDLAQSYGVEFEICEVGMKKHNIDPKTLYPFVKIVPNATLALIDAQSDGYGYLPLF